MDEENRAQMMPDDLEAMQAKTNTPTMVFSMSRFRVSAGSGATADEDGEDPPERSAWHDLRFSHALAERVRGQLEPVRPMGVRHLADLDHAGLTARMEEIRAAIDAGGCAVVHVVGHGFLRRGSTADLLLVASDTLNEDSRTAFDVRRFLQDVDAGQGHVLLLLDVCHGGAGIDWTRDIPRTERRLFVIAACPPDSKAWGGRFSQAVADVLDRLVRGHTGVDPTERHVRLAWLKDEVYRRLLQLCEEDSVIEQEVASSELDGPVVEFLNNPWFREDPVDRLELRYRWMLQDFIDSVDPTMDLQHYVSRAAGRKNSDWLAGPCHFSGRREELAGLADWAAGGAGDGATLVVVTGSPGAGKSALLGVVVCCTHPQLSKTLRTVVDSVPTSYRPDSRETVAAVNARGMTLEHVMDAVGKQLSLHPPHGKWAAQDLVESVAGLDVEPLIVIDSLDEAAEGSRIAVELLIPLAGLEFPAAPRRWACQLLVGARPYWKGLRPLSEAADHPKRWTLDLDTSDPGQLKEAYAEYTERLLGDSAAYRDKRLLRKEIAQAVAERVARSGTAGGFLMAQLAARTIGGGAPIDDEEVKASVATIPLTLAGLLDGQLSATGVSRWARPVLTAIAFAEGEGIPAEHVRAVAAVFDRDRTEPTWDEVNEVLDEMSFYLRRDVDPQHGTTLYRLFHQELVSHVRETAKVGDPTS